MEEENTVVQDLINKNKVWFFSPAPNLKTSIIQSVVQLTLPLRQSSSCLMVMITSLILSSPRLSSGNICSCRWLVHGPQALPSLSRAKEEACNAILCLDN